MKIKNLKIKKFNDFLNKIYTQYQDSPDICILKQVDSVKDLKGPLHIAWEITSDCNFKCIHCRAADNDSKLHKTSKFSLDEYKQVIDNMAELQLYTLGITGGEPFTHPHIFEIIDYCKSKKLNLIIYTNASLIDDKTAKFLSGVLDANDIMHVSLDGAIKEDNDKQRGQGTFERIINGIECLARHNVPLRLTIVPTTSNIEHITDIVDIAKKYNIKEISAVPLMNAGRAKDKNLMPEPTKLFDKEIEMIDKLEKNAPNIIYRGGIFGPVCFYKKVPGVCSAENFIKRKGNLRRICDAGTRQLFVDSNGNVYPCHLFASSIDFAIGNVFKTRIEDLWKSKKLTIFKEGIEMEKCSCLNCELWDLCNGGCMGLSWINNKTLTSPDPRCNK